MHEKVTLLCTSCGRFDLLQKTLSSFFALNTYPIEEIIINEDSGNFKTWDSVYETFKATGINFRLLVSSKEGQAKALDRLFDASKTDFVFTTEDDWKYSGNPNFISDSLQIMMNTLIHHVWVRDKFDHNHPLKSPQTINGVSCQEVMKGYQTHWGGFSHNPGLKRVSDYKRMFPNGFSEFGDEIKCSENANKFNYKAVSLVYSACVHIGWNRHTPEFKI